MRPVRFLAISISMLVLTIPAYAGTNDWFYRITPPGGAAAFDVVPYTSEYRCKHWLGCALFLHGPHCPDHPPAGTPVGPFDEQKCNSVLAGWTQGRPGPGCFYVGDTYE